MQLLSGTSGSSDTVQTNAPASDTQHNHAPRHSYATLDIKIRHTAVSSPADLGHLWRRTGAMIVITEATTQATMIWTRVCRQVSPTLSNRTGDVDRFSLPQRLRSLDPAQRVEFVDTPSIESLFRLIDLATPLKCTANYHQAAVRAIYDHISTLIVA